MKNNNKVSRKYRAILICKQEDLYLLKIKFYNRKYIRQTLANKKFKTLLRTYIIYI